MTEMLAILVALSSPAERHGIPPALVRSIVWHESRGSDAARSGCLARGQMQVRFSSVCRGCSNRGPAAHFLHLRQVNHFYGTQILSRWLRHARRKGLQGRQALLAALAGYNGGWQGFRGGSSSRRARGYARRVLQRARL